jgi:hypothetical protein
MHLPVRMRPDYEALRRDRTTPRRSRTIDETFLEVRDAAVLQLNAERCLRFLPRRFWLCTRRLSLGAWLLM